jgi:hypothetical protein
MSDAGTGVPPAGRRAALPAVPFGQQSTEPLPTTVPERAGGEAGQAPPPPSHTMPLPNLGGQTPTGPPVPPVSGSPLAGGPAAHRGPLVPVLAAAAALLLVATVVLGALVVTAKGHLDRARAEAASSRQVAEERGRELAASRRQVEALKGDVARARDDLAATREELTGTRSRLGDTEADKQLISNCLGLVRQFFDAAGAGDGGKARDLLGAATKPCEDANAVAAP